MSIILMRKLMDVGYNISMKVFFTYRSRVKSLVHVVDVIIDVIVVVKMIAGGVDSRVVVACVMIRVVAIVMLVMLVQHHRGKHVERLSRTVSTRNEQDGLSKIRRPHYFSFRCMIRIVHFD